MYLWLLGDRRQARTPMKLRAAIPVEPPACTIRLGAPQIDIVLARASFTSRSSFFYMLFYGFFESLYSRMLLCFGPCNIELARAKLAI